MKIKKLLLSILLFISAGHDTYNKLQELCTTLDSLKDPLNKIPAYNLQTEKLQDLWPGLVAFGLLELTDKSEELTDESEDCPRLVINPKLESHLANYPYLESVVDTAYLKFHIISKQMEIIKAVNNPSLPKDSNLPKLYQEIKRIQEAICAAEELKQALESIVLEKDEVKAETATRYIESGIKLDFHPILRCLYNIIFS